MKTVEFRGQIVPEYITKGNHARFIKPIFDEICIGDNGLDIGFGGNEHANWIIRNGCYGIDMSDYINEKDWFYGKPYSYSFVKNNEIIFKNQYYIDSDTQFDWIFSSHCLEHIPDYTSAFENWVKLLSPGGIMFLYLPHPNCLYWRPEYMPTKKHLHLFCPETIKTLFFMNNFKNIFCSEMDMAYSFCVYGEYLP